MKSIYFRYGNKETICKNTTKMRLKRMKKRKNLIQKRKKIKKII